MHRCRRGGDEREGGRQRRRERVDSNDNRLLRHGVDAVCGIVDPADRLQHGGAVDTCVVGRRCLHSVIDLALKLEHWSAQIGVDDATGHRDWLQHRFAFGG